MTRRILTVVALLAVATGCIAGRGMSAQVAQQPSAGDPLTLAQPLVLSGPDVGFRVVRMDGEIPVGEIVVRMNGAWVAASIGK